MAIRLKSASYLAEQIKDLGYRDEIGYQTILYFNETEIRKLLIFLIEKLPKDTGNFAQIEEIGYVPKLLIDIKKKLKPSVWIPPSLCNRGVHSGENNFQLRSYGNSCPLKIKKLTIPSSEHHTSEGEGFYINLWTIHI